MNLFILPHLAMTPASLRLSEKGCGGGLARSDGASWSINVRHLFEVTTGRVA